MANHSRSIKITADPIYLSDQSDPEASRFVFAYTIVIENTGPVAAQLISRHWIITDGHERIQEVRGLGVVGEQPWLRPGQSYSYTSGCTLETPTGTMRGTYCMMTEQGQTFDALIPEFALLVTNRLH